MKNKKTQPYLFLCDDCNTGIYNGEIYYEICERHYHRDCLCDNYTVREILALAKIRERTAWQDLIY